MRLSFREWRKQIFYFKRQNLQQIQKVRGIVNTIAFFCVWGYAGYFIASRAERSQKETGIPHGVRVARLTGEKYVTKYNWNTGETETIGERDAQRLGRRSNVFLSDVLKVFADKEAEERRTLLEERRVREEARRNASNNV